MHRHMDYRTFGSPIYVNLSTKLPEGASGEAFAYTYEYIDSIEVLHFLLYIWPIIYFVEFRMRMFV